MVKQETQINMTPSNKDIATIAILDTKLDGAIAQITELKTRFDTFQAGFIRQDVYNIKHEELVKQVAENSAEIRYVQKSRWVMPVFGMVLGGVLTFLITYALTHR